MTSQRKSTLPPRGIKPTAALVTALTLFAGTACSTSGADKAGGTQEEKPIALTLANHEDGPNDVQPWIDAVEKLSGGSIRIEVENRWRHDQADYDRGTIADVRTGTVDLAKIAARAYDAVGVNSFQALVAPFLIDNETLERRVLESDIPTEMLKDANGLDLVGLAVLPTDLRKPLGLSRPLVGVDDYRGARIGVREGEVAKATFEALGATPVLFVPGGPVSSLAGIELGLEVIKGNHYDKGARSLTANVNLWPKPITVVINKQVFRALSPRQQDALREARSVALAQAFTHWQSLSEESRSILCRRGLRFVQAGPADLAALRRAVQPVYDRIESDPDTEALLDRIMAMKQELPAAAAPDAPTCTPSEGSTGAATGQETKLDGVYKTSFTRDQLASSPHLAEAGEINDENWGSFTLTFQDGRVSYVQVNSVGDSSASGTFTVTGDAVVLRFTEGVNAGETFAFRWSLYRDTLTLTRDDSLGVGPTPFLVAPWRKAT